MHNSPIDFGHWGQGRRDESCQTVSCEDRIKQKEKALDLRVTYRKYLRDVVEYGIKLKFPNGHDAGLEQSPGVGAERKLVPQHLPMIIT